MKTVYLAGPISGCTFEGCTSWRDYAITKLSAHKIKGLSPMRGKEYLASEKIIDGAYSDFVLSCSRGVMTRDRFDTSRCDVLLVNLLGATKVSIGTVMEVAWANLLQKPVIAIIEPTSNVHDHPMIQEAIGFRVQTVDQALDVAISILK